MLFSRVKELSKFGELIAGDKKERLVIDKIKEFFEEKEDVQTYVYPQNVLHWEQKEIEIECERNKVESIAMPYSPSIDIETTNYKVIKSNSLLEINKYYHFYKDKLLIFTMDDYLRKFVLKNGKLLSHLPQPPPEVPAFYVREKDIPSIRGNCRFYLKSKFRESTGYTIEAIQPGRSEERIYVTAHHDHWFSGEHDDLVSVSMLTELKSDIYELHLISFTAEESGCFFSSFSWACGSFYFLKNKKLDNTRLVISLDNVTQNSRYYVTPGLSKYFPNSISSPSAYSDSYNFLKLGIPTVTVSDTRYPYYHSEADIVNNDENFEPIIKFFNDNLLSGNIQINLDELKNNIIGLRIPLELKTVALNLIEKNKYNDLLKFYGSILDFNTNVIETYIFHKIVGLQKAYDEDFVTIEDFDEFANSCENDECKKNREKYMSYLLDVISKEYLSELENLF